MIRALRSVAAFLADAFAAAARDEYGLWPEPLSAACGGTSPHGGEEGSPAAEAAPGLSTEAAFAELRRELEARIEADLARGDGGEGPHG